MNYEFIIFMYKKITDYSLQNLLHIDYIDKK